MAPKPVNILIGTPLPFTVKDIERLGADASASGRHGSGLLGRRGAHGERYLEQGTFKGFADGMPGAI